MKVNVRKNLRALLKGDEIIVAPGAYDALSGRIAEEAGFKAIYVGGSNINAVMGYPDGEATRTEYLARVREIAEVLKTPVVADIETGFGAGSALDLMRTIKEFERAGVAAVHCEDQPTATKSQVTVAKGQGFRGAEVIPMPEMLKKIEAALEAREDEDFVFIARTDARTRYGLQEALDRGRAYAKAGADMVVVQSLQSVDELKRAVDHVGAPLLIYNGGSNDPLALSSDELQKIGVRMVTFGSGVLRTSAWAVKTLMEELRRTGTDKGFVERMISKEEVNDLIGTPARDALRKRFMETD
ncbi:MAG TPA: isocitrate lyase/PEP mutase family protein [Devosiaceae bacterium]|jgi:2-methylisocitrate lyase-like PEP mutase family enzyme